MQHRESSHMLISDLMCLPSIEMVHIGSRTSIERVTKKISTFLNHNFNIFCIDSTFFSDRLFANISQKGAGNVQSENQFYSRQNRIDIQRRKGKLPQKIQIFHLAGDETKKINLEEVSRWNELRENFVMPKKKIGNTYIDTEVVRRSDKESSGSSERLGGETGQSLKIITRLKMDLLI